MNAHADKTQENKRQSVANTVSQKQRNGESTFQFVDNRPEKVAQRKLQEMVNNHTVQQKHHIKKKDNLKPVEVIQRNLRDYSQLFSSYREENLRVAEDANCHGYTMGKDKATPQELIEFYKTNQDKKIIIGLKDGQIGHSAIYREGRIYQKFIDSKPFSLEPSEALSFLKGKYESVIHLSPLVSRASDLSEMDAHTKAKFNVEIPFDYNKLNQKAYSIFWGLYEVYNKKHIGEGIDRRNQFKIHVDRMSSIHKQAQADNEDPYEALNRHLIDRWRHYNYEKIGFNSMGSKPD